MTITSLSDYVDFLDEYDQLEVVRDADWELEIGALTTIMIRNRPSPALLFDDIRDHESGYRVLTNALTTPLQWSAAMGFDPVTSKREATKLQKNSTVTELYPPKSVSSSPLLDNIQRDPDVDLHKFPAPQWNELDGGRYIGTADVVITKHANSGRVNAGVYRVQVQGANQVTVFISPGHDGKSNFNSYLDLDEPAPVVISVGQPPDLFIGASEHIATGESGTNELEYIGGRRGEPIDIIEGEVTGLPLPADADIVLEGHIYPDSEPVSEGPFGEFTGYLGGETSLQPVEVERVYHRDDPIILGVELARPPAQIKSEIRNAAEVWRELENSGMPGIYEVNTLPSGPNGWLDVISIEQQYGGHSVQVGMHAATTLRNSVTGRFTIIVDSDIDVFDQNHVLWAVASRCDPITDLHVIGGVGCTPLNPLLTPEQRANNDFTSSRVVVDATRPYYWRDEFPTANEPSDELIRETYDRWEDLIRPYDQSNLDLSS